MTLESFESCVYLLDVFGTAYGVHGMDEKYHKGAGIPLRMPFPSKRLSERQVEIGILCAIAWPMLSGTLAGQTGGPAQ